MSELVANQRPGVIHIRFYDDVAVTAANELDLPDKVFDEALQKRYEKDKAEEMAARMKVGLGLFVEQNLFVKEHPTGVPNVCVGDMLHEMLDDGYFLIAGDHEIDDKGRDRARLVFSCKREDIGYWHATPTRSRMIDYMEALVSKYGHFHDRRRIHPVTGNQVGNNAIDLIGSQPPSSCRKYKMMHLHDRGEVADGPYSYEVRFAR